MSTYDVDLDLIFGILDMAIDAKIHVDDNQVPKASKNSDDLTVTNEENDAHSSSTSRVNVERIPISTSDQVVGEHLISTSQNVIHDSYIKGEYMTSQAHVEGERMSNHVEVEGEHHISNPLVMGEPSGSNADTGNDKNKDFDDVTDNISISGEG